MSELPRVFVGTMYCGEGDYLECHRALAKQTGVTITHRLISDLPEKEAHNTLWATWRTVKHEHDMFVKLDADTVLAHDEVLLEFWRMMQANARITGIQAPLHDYFTDGNINGLNCFSPRVTFRDTADELFCDRQVDVDHDIVVKADGVSTGLRPAGLHCHHATERQAFHFGIHRALKKQFHVIDQVRLAQRAHGDDLRAWALIGAGVAPVFNGSWGMGGFNYGDELFIQEFERIKRRFADFKESM